MAFQNLRVGGKLYILHKDNSIRIEEAEVTNITMPTMRFMPQGMNQTPLYVVDIVTKVGDATYNFPQVPAQLDIADYGNNGNVVISTNADTIASTTAKALAPYYEVTLIYAFEKPGVLKNPDDDSSVIGQITRADFDRYVADGTVAGGMIPKIENALGAIDAGVERVIITKADAIDGKHGTIII